MAYLIDGYNLLHALGRLTRNAPRGGLEASRRWLLQQMRAAPGLDEPATVVFDAHSAPVGVPRLEGHGSITFLFALGQTADDLIEDLITREAVPHRLTVVSDDHRIRMAARRRGCGEQGCLEFYDRLQVRYSPGADDQDRLPVDSSGKPDSLSEDEVRHWLEAFGERDDAPRW